jgi:hypothetical protein
LRLALGSGYQLPFPRAPYIHQASGFLGRAELGARKRAVGFRSEPNLQAPVCLRNALA